MSTPNTDPRPRYIVTFADCPGPAPDSDGYTVLLAHLLYVLEQIGALTTGATLHATRPPTSRFLRREYATHLSRNAFARGVRELIAAGILDPQPESLTLRIPQHLAELTPALDEAHMDEDR